METLSPPYLLLATPILLDPNFVQSVVLMGHHDTEGAMGWIVNRLHERPVRELLAPGQQQGVHAQTPLHLGGPVPADALLAVFHHATRRRGVRRDRAGPVRVQVGGRPAAALLAGARPGARAGPAGVRILRLGRGPARARDGRGRLAGAALRRGAWPSPRASTTSGGARSSGSASTRRCSPAAPAASTDGDARKRYKVVATRRSRHGRHPPRRRVPHRQRVRPVARVVGPRTGARGAARRGAVTAGARRPRRDAAAGGRRALQGPQQERRRSTPTRTGAFRSRSGPKTSSRA